MIEFQNICKTYRVAKRQAGFTNAVKSLFSREYETIHALDDVSFRIADGDIIGYIGPNGAGKSTTVKVMCGILTPDSGTCLVNGKVPWKERASHVKDIGVVFGQRTQLWWDVPVIDSFELLRDMYKIDDKLYRKNLDELTRLLDLSELLKTPARNLSLGQRMRCEIAAPLLHDPKVMIVDEPTAGLDPEERIRFRNLLCEVAEERIVILSTHIVGDIEATCENIAILNDGELLWKGTVSQLLENARGKVYTAEIPAGMLSQVKRDYIVTGMLRSERTVTVRFLADGESGEQSAGLLPGARTAMPGCEDAYMYCLRQHGCEIVGGEE